MSKLKEIKNESREYPVFVCLLSYFAFKTLWILGDKLVREFFNRVIYNVVGFSIRNYYLSSNELGTLNYKSIANKVDALLVSPDKKTKVNIELNRYKTATLINKNNSYLMKLGGEAYAGMDDKYQFNIEVTQINVNSFSSLFDPDYTINEYGFYNKKTMTERMNVKIFDITLPNKENLCYDISEEFRKDLEMFSATSYEEMARIAEGNKEREAVMEALKRLGSDPEFVDYYDHEEFEELEKAELYRNGLAEGEAKGRAEGQADFIKKLIENGTSIEDISKMSGMSVEDIYALVKR